MGLSSADTRRVRNGLKQTRARASRTTIGRARDRWPTSYVPSSMTEGSCYVFDEGVAIPVLHPGTSSLACLHNKQNGLKSPFSPGIGANVLFARTRWPISALRKWALGGIPPARSPRHRVGVARAFPVSERHHDRPARLDEFQHIGHRAARLLRPVRRKLRPYRH
jgi:hypothetical protein